MKFDKENIFAWLGAIASIIAIVGAVFGVYQFLGRSSVLDENHFVGLYSGEAEGYKFDLGIESVGGTQLVGEVNFDDWDFVEVQLRGSFDSTNEIAVFTYRRNENHPLGPDQGEASITYNRNTKQFSGFWASSVIAGNEQKWLLKKNSNEYSVKSWDG